VPQGLQVLWLQFDCLRFRHLPKRHWCIPVRQRQDLRSWTVRCLDDGFQPFSSLLALILTLIPPLPHTHTHLDIIRSVSDMFPATQRPQAIVYVLRAHSVPATRLPPPTRPPSAPRFRCASLAPTSQHRQRFPATASAPNVAAVPSPSPTAPVHAVAGGCAVQVCTLARRDLPPVTVDARPAPEASTSRRQSLTPTQSALLSVMFVLSAHMSSLLRA